MTSVVSVLVSEKILDNKILCLSMSSVTISRKQQQNSNSNIRDADPEHNEHKYLDDCTDVLDVIIWVLVLVSTG